MISEKQKMDFLRGFYGKILADLGVGISKLDELMESYLINPKNFPKGKIPLNSKERMVARGNVRKEILSSSNMTFKVFNKGLRFLNVKKIVYYIEIAHENNTISQYCYFGDNVREMFNIIYNDIKPTKETINKWLDDYINNENNFKDSIFPKTKKEKMICSNYVKKEFLLTPKMSFKTFIKALKLIKVKYFTIRVQLTHNNLTVTEHEYSLNMDDSSDSYRAPPPTSLDYILKKASETLSKEDIH